MIKKLILSLLLFVLSLTLRAQSFVSEDVGFINYLIGNRLYKDAATYLEYMPYSPSDTLAYFKGLSSYYVKDFQKAVDSFKQVSPASDYFENSVFCGAVCAAYNNEPLSGYALLDSYSGPLEEMKHFQKAGLSLLGGDRATYEAESAFFTYAPGDLYDGETLLKDIYNSRYLDKKKSPALAATLSALVPGLGKIYVGRPDEGVAAFLTVGILAGFTAESWIKQGPADWRTIVFGTLGSLFYLGNIYGSYVSVGIQTDFINDAQNNSIVVNLHLPVRNLLK